MISEIICVGTELLLGDQIDTNSPFIAQELAALGIDVFYQSNVGDNSKRLRETIKIAMSRSELIIITGGLGPTEDDLTKETLAQLLNIPLEYDQKELERIQSYFTDRGLEMPPNNFKQALMPKGAIRLNNSIGTASGLALVKNNNYFILLPGPPSELRNILQKEAIPWLQSIIKTEKAGIYSQILKFVGISESKLEEELIDLFQNQNNPTLALLAKEGEIHCRLTAKVPDKECFLKKIEALRTEILSRVGEYCYGFDQDRLEEIIIKKLKQKELSLAVFESCTGGLLSTRLTNIPGSSQCFQGGVVTYTNEIKNTVLDIPNDVLKNQGAISAEVALLMAKNGQKLFKTDFALAITGNAGPTASEGKAVGLVYIALVGPNIEMCHKILLKGDRSRVRWLGSNHALDMLRKKLNSTR